MTILVTGGAGYIGSHMVSVLARAGRRPVVIDNFVKGHRDALAEGVSPCSTPTWPTARWSPRSCASTASTRCCTSRRGSRWASRCGTRACTTRATSRPPWRSSRANLDAGVKRFILSSSAAVYGAPTEVPIPEWVQFELRGGGRA